MRLSLCSNTIICFLLICVVECPVTYRGAYTSVTPGDAAWQEALELLVSRKELKSSVLRNEGGMEGCCLVGERQKAFHSYRH